MLQVERCGGFNAILETGLGPTLQTMGRIKGFERVRDHAPSPQWSWPHPLWVSRKALQGAAPACQPPGAGILSRVDVGVGPEHGGALGCRWAGPRGRPFLRTQTC